MSARHRGSMVQRGLNRWLLRVYLGRDANGKARYSSKMIQGTTAEARKALTAMLSEVDTKAFIRPAKTLLSAYLESWLTGKIDVSPATLESYRSMLNHFLPKLGHRKLHEIDRGQVQAVLADMTGQGLARRTLEYAKAVLHAAFSDAVRENLLVKNPADYIKLPPKVKRAPTVLTLAQVTVFLDGTKESPYHAFWTLQFTSGLRPQEAYALKWSDIDLDGKWLSVQRVSADQGKGHYELIESPKTEGSTRRIGLPESTVEALRAHKKAQAVAIMAAGPKYKRQELVFAQPGGGLLDPSKVRREFKAALTAINEKRKEQELTPLPSIRHYDTRHTHLTSLLQNGADIAWVAARAGHRNITMTRDHYAHVMPEVHREMGEMTERLMKAARK